MRQKKKILLATSAMPLIFPQEEIEGHKYLDGGARLLHGDNVPVRPLYEIFPRDSSGGLLDYSA